MFSDERGICTTPLCLYHIAYRMAYSQRGTPLSPSINRSHPPFRQANKRAFISSMAFSPKKPRATRPEAGSSHDIRPEAGPTQAVKPEAGLSEGLPPEAGSSAPGNALGTPLHQKH